MHKFWPWFRHLFRHDWVFLPTVDHGWTKKCLYCGHIRTDVMEDDWS